MQNKNIDTALSPDFFGRQAASWWDEKGPMRALHAIGPARIQFIKETCGELKGKTLLDVGCGAGLACEPLARLGAHVTGLDLSEELIAEAKRHASLMELDITYQQGSLPLEGAFYDITVALELLEHVDNWQQLVRDLVAATKPGGMVVLSTLNRTIRAYALGIVLAEHVLRMVPKGAHQWNKFIQPSELAAILRESGCEITAIKGFSYHPWRRTWALSSHTQVNYILAARRQV